MNGRPSSKKFLGARSGGFAVVAVLTFLFPLGAVAQNGNWNPQDILAAKEWVAPPGNIAEAVLAPRYLNVTLNEISADRNWFVHEIGDGPVPMERFSKPFDELGGLFIDYGASRNRTLTIRSNVGVEVVSAADGRKVTIQVPNGARVSNATWSPDGAQLAFFVHTENATHIYVADPANGRSRQITRTPVVATAVTSFQWTANGQRIATILVPDGRSARPLPPAVPTGPQVKQTLEGENILRTYASLMKTPYDEALLEWHVTGQLALVDVADRQVEKVGAPAMVWAFDFSRDGEYARVTTLDKPFSYIVPVSSFGKTEEIWDRTGKKLLEFNKTEISTGLRGDVPDAPGVGGSGDDSGKRQVAWRRDNQGLTFLEQEAAPDSVDEARGSQGGEGQRSRGTDRVMQWTAPFDSASLAVLYQQNTRMSAHKYSPDHQTLFLTERQGQNTHEFAVMLSDPGTKHTLARYGADDSYANPGSIVLDDGRVPSRGGFGRFGGRGGGGGEVVQLSADHGSVFFYGTQYDRDPVANGPRSFLDKVAIAGGEKVRVYESDNEGGYEAISAILDIDADRFVVSRESSTQVKQSYLRNGSTLGAQLTQNKDYTPDLTSAPRERFVVERPDGFRFMVNVTLPPGYTGGRLPAMFWFYPREYEDQDSYDETARTFNKNAFPNFGTRSMQYMARLGYAVVEPDAPIVGKAGQMNNNYEHDLRNNLAAVIDELDRRGLIDRQRLGIGGHSYGAFSTANAMAHTPFFKAGIAGDGNYNRTFTPLAFQSERRIFWEAKDVYLSMSPFLYADQITGALLMYHGLSDQNVGTDPAHTPRMFHALNGLGKEASMYLYPFEDHGPATKETLLDLWARWTAWLDVHLKADQKNTISEQ
ncbi:MAG TPA: prolyl oligopeptidase family serine peptidase [Longimicrobiales bacterium]|nr:prolyl oligopeptidase family serine peptidase [Longimicrobiales bacterium]